MKDNDTRCAECGKSMKKKTVDHRYTESGLDNVYLMGVDVYDCPSCGENYVHIPNPVQLHVILSIGLALKDEPLRGAEIRFMRKEAGMNGKSFAEAIGVSPITLSRWENDDGEHALSHDRLIRFAFMTMMSERLKTLMSWVEGQVKRSEVIKVHADRVDIDATQLKYVELPGIEECSDSDELVRRKIA